jgi:16S rRNA (adenine1518-N6/adenine1519-N6)-dimethyltransferase
LANGIKNSPELSFEREDVCRALESLGFDENVRGEKLTLADFAALSDIIKN